MYHVEITKAWGHIYASENWIIIWLRLAKSIILYSKKNKTPNQSCGMFFFFFFFFLNEPVI